MPCHGRSIAASPPPCPRPAGLEQRVVEEAHHAALVLAWPRVDSAGVLRLGDLPERLRLPAPPRRSPRFSSSPWFEFGAAMSMTGRGAMRPTSVFRFAAGASFVKTAIAPTLTAMLDRVQQLARSARRSPSISISSTLSLKARAPAPSDTTALQVVVLGGRLEHHLAADRQADPADAVGVDVGARLEVVDRRLHVAVAAPAEGVWLAVALALAAAVEDEHAVAVASEHRLPASAAPCGRGTRSRPRRSSTARTSP